MDKQKQLRTMHLFAGAGGGILADLLLGHRPVCAVEINEYCQRVLHRRQQEGCLPWFPIWDDVRTFDGRQWRGLVDIVAGGFPCQDISIAGKGEGIEGCRSGLWKEMARIVSEVRPQYVFVENSPMLVDRGLTVVIGDLAEMGYDARWCCVSAQDNGAPHQRDRIWILASSKKKQMANPEISNVLRQSQGQREKQPRRKSWWASELGLDRVAHGVADRTNRLKAIGAGQVPAVAATAWRILTQE